MKKYLLLLMLSFSLLAIVPTYADNLKHISLNYCDTTGNVLQYTMDPGESKDICYTVSNSSPQEVTMKINFIDGTFTNDQWQNKTCLNEDAKENFGQYVSEYEQLVTLSWWESRSQTAKLFYPQWTDGQYYGCVTYSVIEAPIDGAEWENSNFSILMRKAKFIDVLVGHPEKITWGIALKGAHGAANLSPNANFRIYQDPADNKYVIELTIQNVWWVEEDIVVTGVAFNILNYRYTFVENRKLLKWQEFVITKKLDSIPNYYFDVTIDLAYTPIIPGIVSSTSYIHETARIYIFNFITIITIIWLLLLLLILLLLIKSLTRDKNKQQIIWTPTNIPPAPTPTI